MAISTAKFGVWSQGKPQQRETTSETWLPELRHGITHGRDDLGAASGGAAPTREPVSVSETGIAFGDWDDLFNAVQQRLAAIASGQISAAVAPTAVTAGPARSAILDCVAALEQLHATVTAELVRRDGLEMAFVEAQTSLAQVKAALLGTQEDERRARHKAAHDDLTELPNRGYFVQRISHELSRSDVRQRSFAVLFLDLDGFKGVNDNHGHAAGDELLRVVAARLRRLVRAQDMVCRAGGDEFACLIEGLHDRAQLALMASKIVESISAPCTLGGLQLSVQASIGIAIAPHDGWNADTLLRNADMAMYAAKRQHLGHTFCSRDDAAALAHGPCTV